MNQYLNHLPEENLLPQIQIINANTDNRNKMDSYREMRFGLASTLLGNGYYSFDSGDQNHAQRWWYDEYDNYLGKSISSSINLLNPGNNEIKPGFLAKRF